MPLFPRAPIRVQPFLGYRSTDRLRIGARALRSDPATFDGKTQWRAFRTMLTQFASAEVAGVRVTLSVMRPDGVARDYTVATDREGYAWFDIGLDGDWPRPERTAWEAARMSWQNATGRESAAGHILAPGTAIRLAVISDIDDTIIETGMSGGLRNILRNWRRVFTQLPHDRIVVPEVGDLYGELGGGPVGEPVEGRLPATRRPFFYVSSSPWNLFTYLVAFLKGNSLPLGPLLLRDWSFDRQTLGQASHAAHKGRSIEAIQQLYPDLRFALIGDDTQGDLAAFAEAVTRAPGRIAAVFIRRVDAPLSPEEIEAKATIESAGVPLWLGSDYAAGSAFLQAAGLAPDGDAATIMHAIEEGKNGDGGARTG